MACCTSRIYIEDSVSPPWLSLKDRYHRGAFLNARNVDFQTGSVALAARKKRTVVFRKQAARKKAEKMAGAEGSSGGRCGLAAARG